MEQTVVIVGAGPVGLWLAAELRLGVVSVAVIEQRTERDPHSKAFTIHPRTIEVLASRGVHERFLAEGLPQPSEHFALLGNRLDFRPLDTPFPFTLWLPRRVRRNCSSSTRWRWAYGFGGATGSSASTRTTPR